MLKKKKSINNKLFFKSYNVMGAIDERALE